MKLDRSKIVETILGNMSNRSLLDEQDLLNAIGDDSPYRIPAPKPKEEEKPMSENIMFWKMMLIAAVVMGTVITAACTYTSINENRTVLLKAQIESSQASKEAYQARYMAAKAEADRAMFEQMKK